MRERELRLGLVCYGGISLAVYMHGITKELWHLARASRALHAGERPGTSGTEPVYAALLGAIGDHAGIRLRAFTDIVAGASAGGINGIFLAQAIASGQSLDPLTGLWLEVADIERLIDPAARAASRFSKFWAAPIAQTLLRRSGSDGAVAETVEAAAQAEVRAKLSAFVRARWFEPPFSGTGFSGLLLDALEAMAAAPAGPPLLPPGQPLDLSVTVTDFHGHPERLRLHTPAEAVETEHRLTLGFRAVAGGRLDETPALAFAARATASFPGAFPPFTVAELDAVLAGRGLRWPDRDAFLARALPRQAAIGAAAETVLIDGAVLANAPFQPVIAALRDRPARREVDRRIVYIDPKPGWKSLSLPAARAAPPGFFAAIFGALSDIPREQPIRDDLELIARRSERIRRLRGVAQAIRPDVEAAVEAAVGKALFLDRPTPARLGAWRTKANAAAARASGFNYAAYGQLKLAAIAEEAGALLRALAGEVAHPGEAFRTAIDEAIEAAGLREPHALATVDRAAPAPAFLRAHDLRYRIRRLRFVARRLAELEQAAEGGRAALEPMRRAVYLALGAYLDRERPDWYDAAMRAAARLCRTRPQAALDRLAAARDLHAIDRTADALIAGALAALPRPARRTLLLAYLGFAFYDVATFALLRGQGQDEFDPVKVDRIAPEDAPSIRAGGAEATLKGIQFNNFGAFFSRAYRENDYLWGRLHGAERAIDIVASTLDTAEALPPGTLATLKRRAFRAILDEERNRLAAIPELFAALDREIG